MKMIKVCCPLVKQKIDINGTIIECYRDQLNEEYFTRLQIGKALGYDDPEEAIAKIHNEHKNIFYYKSIFPKNSGKVLNDVDFPPRTWLYNYLAFLEFCRLSGKNAKSLRAHAAYREVIKLPDGDFTHAERVAILYGVDSEYINELNFRRLKSSNDS